MKTPKITLLILILITTLFSASCNFNESPTSSNYYNSNTYFYTIYGNEWEIVEKGHWFTRINISDITRSVINYGTVLVYYRNEFNNWVLLPYSTTLYNEYGQQFSEEIWAGYALGTLDIDYVYSNLANQTPLAELEIKVVIIKL